MKPQPDSEPEVLLSAVAIVRPSVEGNAPAVVEEADQASVAIDNSAFSPSHESANSEEQRMVSSV